MIEGFCKLKGYKAAYGWYREMVESGFKLGANLCNELGSGLKSEGMAEDAQVIYSEMGVKGLDEVNMDI